MVLYLQHLVLDIRILTCLSWARWNALATTPSTKVSYARLLFKTQVTAKLINNKSVVPWTLSQAHLWGSIDRLIRGFDQLSPIHTADDCSKEKDSVHLIQARVVLYIILLLWDSKSAS